MALAIALIVAFYAALAVSVLIGLRHSARPAKADGLTSQLRLYAFGTRAVDEERRAA